MDDYRNLPPGHRGIRLADAPTASVVVASLGDRARLDACLAALLPVCTARGIEVVVARNCPPDEYHALEETYPMVLFMPAPDNATVRQLRAVGLSAADGDIVSLIDDGAVPGSAWLADLPGAAPPVSPAAEAS
jgi:glycosyltransferase involved in cell wall biosynthesis